MRIPSLFSPRAASSRFTQPCLALFLLTLLLISAVIAETALAEPSRLELGAGIAIPDDAFPYETVGPDFSIGLCKPVHRSAEAQLVVEVNHARINHDELIRTEETGSSGGRQTLVVTWLNAGSRFSNAPNLFLGIGAAYFTWTDFVSYYLDGRKNVHSRSNTIRLALQAGIRIDLIKTQAGSFGVTARVVKTPLYDYFPVAVHYSFE